MLEIGSMGINSGRFPDFIHRALEFVHPTWLEPLIQGLDAMHKANPSYLPSLVEDSFLPDKNRLFAAFSLPLNAVKFVLVGEGPYPRNESATGFCFMDGSVKAIWSDEADGGLSKKVNRATSLRNFIKMLLVADGCLQEDNTGGGAMGFVAAKARSPDSNFIQTLDQMQHNLLRQGFLLLNASLVFRPDVAPAKDAKAWLPFLDVIFSTLLAQQNVSNGGQVQLVLWGKIAEQLKQVPSAARLPQVTAEHPYNLSFISNRSMQHFFAPMRLLQV